MRVAILGAGLAGTACAYVLKQRGAEPVIYEAGKDIAPGASGNAIGLYNPRLSAEKTLYADAFKVALETFGALKDIGWEKCGSLHLVTNEKREKRFKECAKIWDGPEYLGAGDASKIAGVEIAYDALYLPQAGIVNPRKLCQRYAENIETHFNSEIKNLSDIKADAIVVANGMNAGNFAETKHLKLQVVRGQITLIAANETSKKVKCNLCYGGYLTPAAEGVHATGATFQRWLDHSQIIPQDDADNLKKLAQSVPALAGNYKVTGQRAAVRATTHDHFPIIGPVKKNIYVSAGHGSHGIITSIWAAHLIADDIL